MNTMKPYNNELVSIITPAYKAEKYISETIDSVISQTHCNWEMIIIDDCSPDNTLHIINEYILKDNRIKLIPLQKNNGPANARNAGLNAAKGEWIAFLDSDDTWHPQKLDKSLSFAKEKNSGFVFTGFRRVNIDNTKTGRYIPILSQVDYHTLLGNTVIATSTVLINKKICGEIEMQNVYYDDFVCWLSILKKGIIAHGLNEDLMRYRIVSQSVSRNKKNSAMKVWDIYRNTEKLNIAAAIWYFSRYATNAYLKYRRF